MREQSELSHTRGGVREGIQFVLPTHAFALFCLFLELANQYKEFLV